MQNPQTILGQHLDWEPERWAIKVLRAAALTDAQYQQGIVLARQQLAEYARTHHIAVDSIREQDTTGGVILYFEGVRLLDAKLRARLQAEFDAARGRPSLGAWARR